MLRNEYTSIQVTSILLSPSSPPPSLPPFLPPSLPSPSPLSLNLLSPSPLSLSPPPSGPKQKDLGKYLSLTLNDYTIQFQGVYERHPHTVVEFYAIDTDTNTYLNVSEAWRKLTENGQDYRILHYHIVHVEMKGRYI